jgi:hypothetical protein
MPTPAFRLQYRKDNDFVIAHRRRRRVPRNRVCAPKAFPFESEWLIADVEERTFRGKPL